MLKAALILDNSKIARWLKYKVLIPGQIEMMNSSVKLIFMARKHIDYSLREKYMSID